MFVQQEQKSKMNQNQEDYPIRDARDPFEIPKESWMDTAYLKDMLDKLLEVIPNNCMQTYICFFDPHGFRFRLVSKNGKTISNHAETYLISKICNEMIYDTKTVFGRNIGVKLNPCPICNAIMFYSRHDDAPHLNSFRLNYIDLDKNKIDETFGLLRLYL